MAKTVETIDQIVARLNSGNSWTGGTITYSMTGLGRTDADGNPLGTGRDPTEADAITTMGSAQMTYAREAFGLWDDVIARTLQENSDRNANITFNYTTSSASASNGVARLYTTSGTTNALYGNVWFTNNAEYTNNASFAASSFGTHAQNNYLHEIGHALGLNHPGAYDSLSGSPTYTDDAEYAQDTEQYTIMSYFTADNYNSVDHRDAAGNYIYPQTPMLHDIEALQRVYGADTETRKLGTTYGFNSNAGRSVFDFTQNDLPVLTIYDAGGIDKLDVSGFNGNQTIDLWSGAYSSVGNLGLGQNTELSSNVAIAFTTVIENAAGGSGNDTIAGNWVNNTLEGNDGDDSLHGRDGDDYLTGGAGRDYYDGGNGTDAINYQDATAGIDVDMVLGKTVEGNGQTETFVRVEDVVGSAFADDIRGDGSNNALYGVGGNDRLDAGAGSDLLKGGGGDDLLRGGSGADTFFGDDSVVDVGFDTVTYAGEGAVVVDLLNDAANAGAAAGDDLNSIEGLIGTANADTLLGDNNANVLEGGAGGDALDGRGGFDTASYASSSQFVAVDLGLGKYLYGDAQGDTLTSIENLTGSAFNDDLRGNADGNVLSGGAGDDDLDGAAGADALYGGYGNDIYYVDTNADAVRDYNGQGIDTVIASATFQLHQTLAEVEYLRTNDAAGTAAIDLYGSNSSNTITGNAGNNRLEGRGGNDYLVTGAGADWMDGGLGFDTMVFHKAMVADWQSGVLDTDIGLDGWLNWEAIQGSAGADRIRTNSWGFAVTLSGGEGDDVLSTGVTGIVADTLRGEGGNDRLAGNAGGDIMDGGLGYDTLDYSASNAGVGIRLYDNTASGGHAAGDTIANAEAIVGSAFDDVMTGNSQANTLSGSSGNDRMNGGSANDGLYGGGGNDTLTGGLGTDTMSGSSGNDIFDFNALAESVWSSARDIITDFTVNPAAGAAFVDRLDVASIDAQAAAAGDQAFVFIGGAAFTAEGQCRAIQVGADTRVQFNTAGAATPEMEVLLQNFTASTLTSADFIL
jgi:serralysin